VPLPAVSLPRGEMYQLAPSVFEERMVITNKNIWTMFDMSSNGWFSSKVNSRWNFLNGKYVLLNLSKCWAL